MKGKMTVNKEKNVIVMTYVLDAPRDLVWKVWTDRNLIPKWWGPRSTTTTVDMMNLEVGGHWRFVQKDDKGEEYGFKGIYKQINPPNKLVYTFEFEPMPGHILLETVEFHEKDGKTEIIDTAKYSSLEDLEGMLNTGMEGGANESMQRLEELLATMK
jgi:uncharacterized protein YndB with AHSA1/START domain